jgi:dihydroorotate dehydrogenase
VLIHTGFPNPGLRTAIKDYAAAWGRAPLPIILHLLSAEPKQMRAAMPRLEELENVVAIELGLDLDIGQSEAKDLVHIAAGELPLIVQIPLHRALELSPALMDAGASAISLGPPRGALPGPDSKLVSGRLYGPALYPQTMACVRALVTNNIPVIAAGGISSKADGEAMLGAGAIAVQMEITLWK